MKGELQELDSNPSPSTSPTPSKNKTKRYYICDCRGEMGSEKIESR